MSLRVRKINKKLKDFDKVKKLYKEAFPKEEITPLPILLFKAKKKDTDFLAIYDGNDLIGLTYICYGDDIAFVLYLAIEENLRGKGYGSQVLELIKNRCDKKRLILNIEKTDSNSPNNEQRLKRKRFYKRNRFKDLKYSTNEGGTEYEMMGYNTTVSKEEYLNFMKKYFGTFLYYFTDIICYIYYIPNLMFKRK